LIDRNIFKVTVLEKDTVQRRNFDLADNSRSGRSPVALLKKETPWGIAVECHMLMLLKSKPESTGFGNNSFAKPG
jgi:hypothetical protein